MKIQKKYYIIVISFIVILLLLMAFQSTLIAGTFGLRPMSHSCLGLRLPEKTVGILPRRKYEFKFLADFAYYVPQEKQGRTYCLGQDIWYGE